jgi:hypothetical protein
MAGLNNRNGTSITSLKSLPDINSASFTKRLSLGGIIRRAGFAIEETSSITLAGVANLLSNFPLFQALINRSIDQRLEAALED